MQSAKTTAYVVPLFAILFTLAGCSGVQIGVEPPRSTSTGSIGVTIRNNASANKHVLVAGSDSAPWKTTSEAEATDDQTEQPTPTPEPTSLAQPTSTQIGLPDQPAAAPSPSPIFTGKLTFLYSGPSSLFPTLAQYHPNTTLAAQGATPDRQWVKVSGPDGQVGWVASYWILSDLDELPVITPQEGVDAYSIYGKVVDTTNVAVDAIDIAVSAQSNSELRTDAYSTTDGSFTAYIPVEMSTASWSVEIVGLGCNSRIMTGDSSTCQLHGYIELAPHSAAVSALPQLSPVIFQYEAVDQVLQGRVVDASGQPVKWMRVFAVRDDGASVFCETDGVGGFSLPISNGSWVVYTVEYNPHREGEHVQLTIQNNAPTDLELNPPD